MSKFAIIETGGKQYKIEEGKTLRVEKIAAKTGEKVTFDRVLLIADGDKITVGTPYIAGGTVALEQTGEGRAKKVTVIKYKQKSRYFKKRGHRQPYSEVKVRTITAVK